MSSEQTLRHFSHPDHLLQISDYQETKNEPSCSACKLDPTGWICTCKKCDYLIHFQCSQIPEQIRLPFHKDHILSLLPKPAYRSGFFTCNACSETGNGFCYSCKECKVDIHILCATMPQIVIHKSHVHPLDLVLSLPNEANSFHCDICHVLGTKQWLYRCGKCGFNAHLRCATPEPTFAGSSSTTVTGKASKKQESSNSTPIKEQNLYPDGISSKEKKGGSTSTQARAKEEPSSSTKSNERKESSSPTSSEEKKGSFVSTPSKENKDTSAPTSTKKEASGPNLSNVRKENSGPAMSKSTSSEEKKGSFVSTPSKENKDASGPALTKESKEASGPNLSKESKENSGPTMSKEKKESYDPKNKKGRSYDDDDEDEDEDEDDDDDGNRIRRRRRHRDDDDGDEDDDDDDDDDDDNDEVDATRKHKDDNEDEDDNDDDD